MKKRTVAGCVALVATLGPIQAAALAQTPLEATRAVQVTEFDVSPARTYGVPSFAVDPDDPLHLIRTAVDLRTQNCGIMESLDGGQSWNTLDSSPSPDPRTTTRCA
ncbi:MAG: hypothetical protein ACR2FG_10040 [Marmoricola sp.]